jgi:predicted O-methyltransferase YrrM
MPRLDPLLDLMFRRMDDCRKHGSDMSAHIPILYSLARLYSFGEIIECGTAEGFSTHALFCGALEGGGHMTSYDRSEGCGEYFKKISGLPSDDPRWQSWEFRAKDAAEGARDWPDASVSLFFLDTSHRLEDTRRELAAWLPKMKPDGVICGHDYYLHLLDDWWKERSRVKQAVDEFAEAHKERFRLQVTPYDQGLFMLWPK